MEVLSPDMKENNHLSLRNVAEYAYCPRLFYYVQVEGVFVPSEDTEIGRGQIHRRVDKPSALSTIDVTDCQRAIRSLSLTSDRLGLSAIIDLVEMSGKTTVPVEYKKGKPMRIGPDKESCLDPWPSDRVQVGLQALLLEENGYDVQKAVIYYAEIKTKVDVPVDSALKKYCLDVLEEAKRSVDGPRPKPLVNDPRCVRCSLQVVCLPDEINQQCGQSVRIRKKVWAPDKDGLHVIVQSYSSKVGVRENALVVGDKDPGSRQNIPLTQVESLTLLGPSQVSTQAIHALSDRQIPIAFLSSAGRLIAMVDSNDSSRTDIRRAQILKFDRMEPRLELSKALVVSKISNQRTFLMRNHGSLPKDIPISLNSEIMGAKNSSSLDELRGHEGKASNIYFQNFSGMIKSNISLEFEINGRKRRPPPDPVNACLSLSYSLLVRECYSALRLARLDPTIGAFHVEVPGRPSLALDLMEPFRILVADSVTISLFNRGALKEGHFLRTSAGCVLTESGRKAFFSAYGSRLDEQITHPVFRNRLSYRRMILLHARMISAWLMGEIPSLDFLVTR